MNQMDRKMQLLRQILKKLSEEQHAIATKDALQLKRILEERQALQSLLEIFNHRQDGF